MRKIILILVLASIILISGCIYFGELNRPSYISVNECPNNAKYVIQKNNLSLIHTCEEEKFLVDGKEVLYVAIYYGPAGDCLSGCIYKRHYSIIADGKEVTIPARPIDEIKLGQKTVKRRQGIGGQIVERYGFACYLDDYELDDIDVALIYENGEYRWRVIYNNLVSEDKYGTQCLLNGYEVVNPEGEWKWNILDLVVEFPKISTCSEEIIEEALFEYCNGRESCIDSERINQFKVGKDHCLKQVAISKLDPNICGDIINPTDKAYCYYGIAFQELNETSCDKITHEYVNERCHNFIKGVKSLN